MCVCMPALMLVFAHAVHLITSTGKVTAALQGEQLPRKYFDLLSGKNSELVCSTACKVAGRQRASDTFWMQKGEQTALIVS